MLYNRQGKPAELMLRVSENVQPRWHRIRSTPEQVPAEAPVLAVRGWFRMSSKWNVSWRQTCYSHCGRLFKREKKAAMWNVCTASVNAGVWRYYQTKHTAAWQWPREFTFCMAYIKRLLMQHDKVNTRSCIVIVGYVNIKGRHSHFI